MIAAASARFPKEFRLRKSREFRFPKYSGVRTEHFHFVYNTDGSGRLGVSLSKKVLRRATARNRVRRLIREVFRSERSGVVVGCDVHVIGLDKLSKDWSVLSKDQVRVEFGQWAGRLRA